MISQKEASESTNASNDHVACWGYPISASKVPTFAMVSFRPHRRPTPFVERSRRDKPPVWGLSSTGFCKLFHNKKGVQVIPNVPFLHLFSHFYTRFSYVFLVFTLALYQPDVRRCAMRKIYVRGTKTWFPNEPRKHQVDSPQYHLSNTTQHWKAFQILSKSHCMLDSDVWQ